MHLFAAGVSKNVAQDSTAKAPVRIYKALALYPLQSSWATAAI